jgi:hypothetical protein
MISIGRNRTSDTSIFNLVVNVCAYLIEFYKEMSNFGMILVLLQVIKNEREYIWLEMWQNDER